jgi:hypothetical protein
MASTPDEVDLVRAQNGFGPVHGPPAGANEEDGKPLEVSVPNSEFFGRVQEQGRSFHVQGRVQEQPQSPCKKRGGIKDVNTLFRNARTGRHVKADEAGLARALSTSSLF